jgi:HSP20 family protein
MDTKTKGNIPITSSKEIAKPSIAVTHSVADMERAIDRFFGRSWPSLWHRNEASLLDDLFEFKGQRIPSLDVIDRDDDIFVRAEIPGIDKKDLNVSITDNLLTIKGQSSSDKKEEKGDYHRHEISKSSFARSVTLPGSVDSSKAIANLKDGILEITLPKVESSKRHKITVQ